MIETVLLLGCYGCTFHGAGNSAQLCGYFRIRGWRVEPLNPPSVRHCSQLLVIRPAVTNANFNSLQKHSPHIYVRSIAFNPGNSPRVTESRPICSSYVQLWNKKLILIGTNKCPKCSLYCDVQSNAATCFSVPTPQDTDMSVCVKRSCV
jgi:hypothetical protein